MGLLRISKEERAFDKSLKQLGKELVDENSKVDSFKQVMESFKKMVNLQEDKKEERKDDQYYRHIKLSAIYKKLLFDIKNLKKEKPKTVEDVDNLFNNLTMLMLEQEQECIEKFKIDDSKMKESIFGDIDRINKDKNEMLELAKEEREKAALKEDKLKSWERGLQNKFESIMNDVYKEIKYKSDLNDKNLKSIKEKVEEQDSDFSKKEQKKALVILEAFKTNKLLLKGETLEERLKGCKNILKSGINTKTRVGTQANIRRCMEKAIKDIEKKLESK